MADLVKVNVPSGVLEDIRRLLLENKQYRNPTEFINECVRIRLFELNKAKIDQKKLEAFFLREEQIKAKHTDASSSNIQ